MDSETLSEYLVSCNQTILLIIASFVAEIWKRGEEIIRPHKLTTYKERSRNKQI